MNLLFLRDWVRQKAIDANIGYADIETLYDVNELLNKPMPCLMFNYEQESNQYRESPFTEVNLKIYLIKNFFEAEKIETELYERDYITPAKNELNELYKDFLRYFQREESPIIEVLRDTKLQLAERVSIEGFLIMEATITINVERQFCLDESGGNFCAPVTYLVEYENGTEIESGSEPSGGNILVQVPNPTVQCLPIPYLIERDGIEYESGNLNQGNSLFVNVPSLCAPCADATVQINGINVVNIPSGGGENILVKNESGNQIGSLVGGEWIVPNCPPTSGWVRPSNWLPLSMGINEFIGLFFVIENDTNILSWSTNKNITVDYGDGTGPFTSPTGTNETYIYNYASIVQTPITFNGKNAKQVIVKFTNISGVGGNLTIGVATNNLCTNFVDIKSNLDATFTFGQNSATLPSNWLYILHISDFELPSKFATGAIWGWTQHIRSVGNSFNEVGDKGILRYSGGEFPDISTTTAPSNNVQNSIKKIGDIFSTTYINFIRDNRSINEIGDLYGSTTTMGASFLNCYSLQKIGIININISGNSIANAFNGCVSLEEINFQSSLINITTTTTAFTSCFNLRRLVLTGMTIGFSITGARLDAAALLEMANSLGTASGSQTITTTGCIGALDTAYITVLNSKGYTVINT